MKATRQNRPLWWILLLIAIINAIVIVSSTRAAGLPGDLSQHTPTPEAFAETPEIKKISPYYSVGQMTLPDGKVLEVDIIGGPPKPPAGFEADRTTTITAKADAVLLPNFPSYSWVFGCSAVSGAMIAGYYDSMGYPNMYTGPTNSGVMPITDTGWLTWDDDDGIVDNYPNNPLVASHLGLEGRTTNGSIDDYWVSYGSTAEDPFITNGWAEHTWESAIGDFMKTSQSVFGNPDAATRFYTWNLGSNYEAEQLTCSQMEILNIHREDGTYGRKLFYEARGYTVGECYNQLTDNQLTSGGFTLADYQAEIDAGHPVFLNLEGHSIVGFGYDGSTIYVRDTWDSDPTETYSMQWGGSYGGMVLRSVSVVKLSSNALPGGFGKDQPQDAVSGVSTSPTLIWESSERAESYEFCVDTTDDGLCNESWVDTGVSTSVSLTDLLPLTTYYWQVRAVNGSEMTYADGAEATFWQFETTTAPPGAFNKLTPTDGSLVDISSPLNLSWSGSSGAEYYEFCLDITEDACSNNWVNNGTSTFVDLSGLSYGTRYFWQVRAVNNSEMIYADGGENMYWSFVTAYRVYLPVFLGE